MKNKKKAFTLVELLAVIVILAIILVIAIPQIIKTIKASRLSAMESSAKLIVTEAEKDYLSQLTLNQYYNATSIPCTDVAKLNEDYESCNIEYDENGVATVTLVGAPGKKFDGITCTGTKDNMVCNQEEPIAYTYVTYNANGGTIDNNNTLRIGYTTRNSNVLVIGTYKSPEKEGSIFKGWYTDTNYTQEFVLNEKNIPINISEIEVYAKWLDASLIYTYTTNDSGTTITGFTDYGLELYNNDELTTLEFPSKLNNKDVIAITPVTTNNKFNGKTKIKEVIIPDTVRSIASQSFGGIPDLSKITIPIDISASSLFDTTKLEKLHLTKGSTGIGVNYSANKNHPPFYQTLPWYQSREYGGASATSVGSSPLKVTIDEGITSIGSNMFRENYRIKLTSNLSNNITNIGEYTFYQSGIEQELSIPNSIKAIGESAFQGSKVTINCNIPSTLTSIGQNAFNGVNLIGSCTIPSTVTTIGNSAFNNTKITELKIKSDSNNYPSSAFNNIGTLEKLEIPITMDGAIVQGTSVLQELHLTKGSTGIGVNYSANKNHPPFYQTLPWYQSREYGGASATSVGSSPLLVTIYDEIKYIGNNMFNGCYRIQLTSPISSGITIGSNAFTNSGVSN